MSTTPPPATTTAAACGSYSINVQGCTASGTNAVSMSSPHIVQYPKPPKRTDAKYLAFASLVGNVLGRWANKDKMDDADAAENKWRDLLAQFTAAANTLLCRADAEYAYAIRLNGCNDTLHERLCAFIQCGYKPDYNGIMTRAMADSAALQAKALEAACRDQKRYNLGANSYIAADAARAAMSSAIGAITTAREKERQFMWDTNSKLYFEGAKVFEQHRGERVERSTRMVTGAGEMMAAAAKGYAFLAESLRKSAEKSSDLTGAGIGLILARFVLPYFIDSCKLEKDCECPATTTTPGTGTGEFAISGAPAAGIPVGQTVSLSTTGGSATGSVDWITGQASICTIDSSGTVTGVSQGTCTVTAQRGSDGPVSTTFQIT